MYNKVTSSSGNVFNDIGMKNNIYFETKRLYITLPSADDYGKLCELQNDPATMKFFGGIRSKEVVKQKIEFFLEHYRKYNLGYGLVYQKESNIFIGRCGLNKLAFDENEERVEIGVILLHQFWNYGFGTELIIGLINYAFNQLKLKEVYGTIDPGNLYSKQAAERSGMQFQGDITYLDKKTLLFKIVDKLC